MDKIDPHEYSKFIQTLFNKNHKTISPESIHFILEWTHTHTYYTQYVCNRVFATGIKDIAINHIRKVCTTILAQNEHIYFQYRALLTIAQWKLLNAFAKEEIVTQPHASTFLKKYDLGTSAMVKRGLDALIHKEMISITYTESGIAYSVYDKFLMRWMQD